MINQKCKFYSKCKMKDPRAATCSATGGHYYEPLRPAGCYEKMEGLTKPKKKRI
jgi:hypothetical protein